MLESQGTPPQTSAVAELLALLDLEPQGNDVFAGTSPQGAPDRLFGGQPLGQALIAAARTRTIDNEYEFGVPKLENPKLIAAAPLAEIPDELRAPFFDEESDHLGWPEIGSRMMTRITTGADMEDGWISVQKGTYRYRLDGWQGGTRVRSVLSEYLGTVVWWDCG